MRIRLLRPWLAAVLVAAGCGSAAPALPDPFRDRQTGPLDEAEIEAVAALLRLEDHRTYDPAAFERLAGARSEEVRRRVALAAGRIRDRDAVPLALGLLRDSSPLVRAEAAFALGQLGDTSRIVVEALRAAAPPDWAPVREPDATVVVEVVAAFGRLGSDAARAAVVEAVRRVHPAPGIHARRIAAEALLAVWRFPVGAGRTTSALSFIGHPDPELRWRAAYALMRVGEPAGTPRLLRALEDSDPRVRMHAVRGLTASRADSAGIRAEVEAGVARAVHDSDPHVRINALRTIATYEPDGHRPAVAERLRDRDANVAIAAAGALGAMGSGSVAVLSAFLEDQRAPTGPRAAALAQLAGLDGEAAAEVAGRWAGEDFHRRYASARAAAALDWERAAPLLATLARDPDPRVAVAALEAAGTLAARPGLPDEGRAALRDLLVAGASSGDPRARLVARRSLAPLITEAELSALRADAGLAEDGEGRPSDDPDHYRDLVRRYVAPVLAGGQRPEARIETAHGRIVIQLLADEAPLTVHNFVRLAEAGFYGEGVWHRVVPNFVLQDGAPAGDPTGGPGWTIRDEVNRHRYGRGTVGMAHSGRDTAGSQWFITHSPQPHLEGGYTVFGHVAAGDRVADRVVQGDVVRSITIVHGR